MKISSLLSGAGMLFLASCATTGELADPAEQAVIQELDERYALEQFPGLGVRLLPDPLHTPVDADPAVQTLSVRDMPARDILRALFLDSDVSVLMDDSVGGHGTFDIKNASTEDVFENVVSAFDLAYRFDGDILRIGSEQQRIFHVDIPALEPTPLTALGEDGEEGATVTEEIATESAFWTDLRRDLDTLRGQDDASRLLVNSRLGTVMASGRPSFVEQVNSYLLAAQGRAEKQVSLEVRVLEVQLSDEFKTGVNWSLLPGFFDVNNVGNHAGTLPGGAIVNQTAAAGVGTFNFGFLNAGQFDLFVDAMEKQGQVRVISKPRVSTLNNVPAVIRVVEQVPVIEREIIDSDGVSRTQFNVRFEDAGVAVSVTPQIGEDGQITCVVQPMITEVSGFVTTPDNLINEPILNTRTVTTTIRIPDGQPVVLGGLRSRTTSENLEAVPILGSIPLVGALFRKTEQKYVETELVLVLHPRILTPSWLREDVERGQDRVMGLRRDYRLSTLPMREDDREWVTDTLGGAPGEPDLARRDQDGGATGSSLAISRSTLARVSLRRAIDALDVRDTRSAWNHLRDAVDLDPEMADAWLLRAILEERREDLQAARSSYERCVELMPDDPLPRNNLGLLELRSGNPVAAEGQFEAALRHHDLGPVRNNLGLAYLAQGRREEAQVEFTEARALSPRLPEAHANLGVCLELAGDDEAAVAAYREFLLAGGDPADPRLRPLRSRWQSLGLLGK